MYHSEYLKYYPKGAHFPHKVMVAHAHQAALYRNTNSVIKKAVVQSGAHAVHVENRYKVNLPKAMK